MERPLYRPHPWHGVPIGEQAPERVIESRQADDKIVAVLAGDAVYGALRELEQLPAPLLDRLRHYFLTYKQEPGATEVRVEIAGLYGRGEAHEVIRRSREDYRAEFPQS